MRLDQAIADLIAYGLDQNLLTTEDVIYAQNRLLALVKQDEYIAQVPIKRELPAILADFTAHIDSQVEKDLFDTAVMDCLCPRPSEVIRHFRSLPIKEATDFFYHFSQATHYIRMERVKKNLKWQVQTSYGPIDITINLSRPEMDPKDIEKAKLAPAKQYPACLLCKENEGYAGTFTHPARQNHRIIPITLDHEPYFLQYSPYVYYNEHCIVFHQEHHPMVINERTLAKLLDFVDQVPHYFIGSNADLPIVGGSILSHDHFQGGAYPFPMEAAKANASWQKGTLTISTLNWPLSVIRVQGQDKKEVLTYASHVLSLWKQYSHGDIVAYSDQVEHNTITPIARKRDGAFELDLVLRNNRTTKDRPYGLFHPQECYHHIKKENIGLIEVLGLAILPGRLLKDLQELAPLVGKTVSLPTHLAHHQEWFNQIQAKYHENDDPMDFLKEEVGQVFASLLADCGVFKKLDDFKRFVEESL